MPLRLADTQRRPKCAKWLLVQKIRVGSLKTVSIIISYIRRSRLFVPRDFLRASRRFASSSFPDRIDLTAGICADYQRMLIESDTLKLMSIPFCDCRHLLSMARRVLQAPCSNSGTSSKASLAREHCSLQP